MLQRLTLFALLSFLTLSLTAQNLVQVTDATLAGDTEYTWTADNEYLLNGLVYLESGSTLTIMPGTVVRGALDGGSSTDNTSALIISRDARIIADGTAQQPIIFTAEEDDLDIADDFTFQDRGEWGGLIILGNATIARPNGVDNIEGIDAGEARAQFGGTNDADDSGVLRYVSIRHGGAALSPNNEINGLTLGGVGSGTVLDYVEVFANFDDGIEWFGGTVTGNHLATAFCGDDGFDYDFGYRGGGQYWFSLQTGEEDTGRAGEHDGANPDELAPFSNPTIVNATYVGIGKDAVASGGEAADGNNDGLAFAVYFRDNAAGTYANSIFYDFNSAGIVIEDRTDTDDTDSYARFQAGDLVLRNNYFFNFGRGNGSLEDILLVIDQDENILAQQSATFAQTAASNGSVAIDPEFNNVDRDGMFDPRPVSFGPAATAASGVAIDGFDATDYVGAFSPGNGSDEANWLGGWSAITETGAVLDFLNGVGEVTVAGLSLDAPVPNPASNLTTLNFELPQAMDVKVTIIDQIGRSMGQFTRNSPAGVNAMPINVSDLPNGTYVLLLDAEGARLAQKLIVRH